MRGAKKIIILNDTSYELHHGCKVVIANLKKLLEKFGFKIIYLVPVNRNWQTDVNFFKYLPKADLVLVNGEGSLHHASQQARTLLSVVACARKYQVQSVLINSIYQANDDEMAEYLKLYSLVYVRDSLSQKQLKQLGIPSDCVPDLTFYSQDTYPTNLTELIGFSDSVSKEISQQIFKLLIHSPNTVFLPIISAPRLDKRRIIKSVLRTHLFYLKKTYLQLFEKKSGFTNHATLSVTPNATQYKKILSSVKLLVAARFHSLCFAIQAHVPFIAIASNSYKIEALIHDIQLNPKRMVKNINELPNYISDSNNFYYTVEEINNIDSYLQRAKAQIDNMFLEIQKLVA